MAPGVIGWVLGDGRVEVCVGVLGVVVVTVDPRMVSADDTDVESVSDGDDIGCVR